MIPSGDLKKQVHPLLQTQNNPSFATYPTHGLIPLRAAAVNILFAGSHTRRLPTITAGPFHYQTFASNYLTRAK
jgi:5-methyltetrahydropteroyltriglutamate--homocysteine methyltransferase